MNLADAGIVLKDTRPGQHRAACPMCKKQGRDTALSVKIDADGGWVAHCHRCAFVANAVGTRQEGVQPTITVAPLPVQQDELSAQWREFWDECAPLAGTLADAYLQHRRCLVPPVDADLRFHPKAWHAHEKKYLPCLVSLLTDALDRTPRSLHFTYLRADGKGKADIERPRLLLRGHRKAGAVIRLFPDDCVTTGLAIAEGVETALCAARAFAPVWSCVDAGNLSTFPALPGVESLTIFADHDKAGLGAAHNCARLWIEAGRHARIVVPKQYGHDWADEVAA